MSAVIPSVHIYMTDTPINNRPGMAGKVALIGAFDTTEANPKLFLSLKDLQKSFGNDNTYKGCAVAPYLFIGASNILAVNITTKTGSGAEEVIDKTMTTQKLVDSLAKIKGEDWDIVFIAETLTDNYMPIITEYLDECFEMKCPAGYIGAISGSNVSADITTAGLAGDHCYGLLTQTGRVNGVFVNGINLAGYYAGLVAGMNVGNTMTNKRVDGLTAISPEYTFETGDAGKSLVEAGITVIKCQKREEDRFVVVNSEQPNGLDLYINRVRDFVVKEMSLHEFLGDRNRQATLSEIEQQLDKIKEECVSNLDLLEDIEYTVEKRDSNCVDINITRLLFAGIITRINVCITLEVE